MTGVDSTGDFSLLADKKIAKPLEGLEGIQGGDVQRCGWGCGWGRGVDMNEDEDEEANENVKWLLRWIRLSGGIFLFIFFDFDVLFPPPLSFLDMDASLRVRTGYFVLVY